VDPDVCPRAPRRVVDQMALAVPQVRRLNRLVLPIVMDRTVRPARRAWDASADPDAVRLVFDLQVPKEAVRDSRPLASVDALEMLAVHPPQAHPKLPLVAPPKVAGAFRSQSLAHFQLQNVAQEFRPQVAAPEPLPEPKLELQVARSARPDESESEQAR